MAEEQPFSQRFGHAVVHEGLIYDDLPERVTDGFINALNRFGLHTGDMAEYLHDELDRQIPFLSVPEDINRLIARLEWFEVCDVIEAVWRTLRGETASQFSNDINDLLRRHYVGYELRDGRLEKVGAKAHDAAVATARGILRDDDLKGPDEQFQKALGFYNRRPEPDLENAVKEAVSSVEGVAQVLLGDTSLTLSKALVRLKKEQDVHPTLIILLEKLYAYRGDAKGVAHALTGDKQVR